VVTISLATGTFSTRLAELADDATFVAKADELLATLTDELASARWGSGGAG
jgi:hypothetical protein